jgi:hypothetical protein
VSIAGQLALHLVPPRSDRRVTALTFVRSKPTAFRPDFLAWLEKNWEIYRAFEREADRIRARGHKHWSARTIIHWLRHETALRENGSDWKINNNASPDLARLYVMMNPGTDDFFEFRVLACSERAA